jgi:DNA-binding CsgD family transcriptional regulator
VKHLKKSKASHALAHDSAFHPTRFVFFDRKTGTRRFEVQASEDGSMPVDQVVAVGEDLVDGLVGGATKLMRSCVDIRSPVPLSRRQYEVRNAVAQNLSNKEIAGKLVVSVRTIKFHASALLEKFHVRAVWT